MLDPHPQAILLDAGNTLVFIDGARVHPMLLPFGADPDPARFREVEREARLRLSGNLGDRVTGHEDQVWRDYFLHLFAQLGMPQEAWPEAGARIQQEHASTHLWSHVDPGTPEALERLKADGYRLGVISNADGRVPALLDEVGLAHHFEFIVDSEVVGISKPDARIFELALKRLGLAGEQCLYVGDLYAVDVVGARGAGLQALLLDPFDHFDFDVPRVAKVADVPDWLAGLRLSPGAPDPQGGEA
jgi:HAD superfamily hydrolase (TIGR01549 family)